MVQLVQIFVYNLFIFIIETAKSSTRVRIVQNKCLVF